MSKTTRIRYTEAFKTKVRLDAHKERETIERLAKKYDIHPNQINSWKQEFIQKSESVFDNDSDHGKEAREKLIENLYTYIGVLSVANEFLKKKSVRTLSERKAMIKTKHPKLSIVKQYDLLSLNHRSFYYEPAKAGLKTTSLWKGYGEESSTKTFACMPMKMGCHSIRGFTVI